MYLVIKIEEDDLTPDAEKEVIEMMEAFGDGKVTVGGGGLVVDGRIVQKSVGYPS